MPRGKDPVWDHFEAEPNPHGNQPIAKCSICSWKHIGIPGRMKAHFATHNLAIEIEATSTSKPEYDIGMPRPRDPIWDSFDREPNPNGRIEIAKCRLCDWKQIGLVDRLKNHLAKRHADHPECQQYMPQVRGVSANEGLDESTELGLQEKVTQLEEVLKKFRAEVDMKMTIVEQVLMTRNELFTVQKKLLDREHALHETVLAHWKNISDLAASGLSLKFSENGAETVEGDLDFSTEEPNQNSLYGKRRAVRATLARRERRKRLKMKHGSGGEFEDSEGGGDEAEENSFPSDFGNDEDLITGDTNLDSEGPSSVPKGLEKKVFVKYYSEEEPQPGERVTRTPVWKYYLREENGDSALCKLCDQEGVQSILKVKDCSTSSLHAHLKFKHKIQVEFNPRQHHGSSETGTAAETQKAGDDDDLPPPPPKIPRNRIGQGSIGRPPSEVWSYFTEFILDGQRKQQCLECGQLVSAQAPRLFRHYKNCKNRDQSFQSSKSSESFPAKPEPQPQSSITILPDDAHAEAEDEAEQHML